MLPTRESFAQKLERLKQEYLAYLKEWQGELSVFEARFGTWSFKDAEHLEEIVHKLSGTGTTYGFPEITEAARDLDYKLSYSQKEGIDVNQQDEVITQLRHLITVCAKACE